MKLKIISTGVPWETKVVNAETGEAVEGVRAVEWSIYMDRPASARIELIQTPVEVMVDKGYIGDITIDVSGKKTPAEWKRDIAKQLSPASAPGQCADCDACPEWFRCRDADAPVPETFHGDDDTNTPWPLYFFAGAIILLGILKAMLP